uniref:Autophagy-related protein 101 n=1 Tax=Aegilops tauschii subsp. strangulata TaxID=200361 RepID=A0A453D966_AEGTS
MVAEHQVCLSFFDEKNKHPGWFSSKTERVYWEQWFINLHVTSPKGQGKSRGSKAPANTKGSSIFISRVIFMATR